MSEPAPAVGVIVVGHGDTASRMLAAAQAIAPGAGLDDVMALDAGAGQTDAFKQEMCDAIVRLDDGAGVVLIVDLFGASPCSCGLREGVGREAVVVAGLNLAMLLKLATLDRATLRAREVAAACASSGARAVTVRPAPEEPNHAASKEAS